MRLIRPIFAALCVLLVGACSDYQQDTPDAVLASARKMVEKGDARKLTELIYAENKEMRALLSDLGGLLGSLQTLGGEVRKAYPKEIEKLQADAAAAAKDGNATSFLQKMMSQAGGGRRRGQGQPPMDPDAAQATFNNAMKELFADPYGWLQKSEGRISTQTVTDDTAAILWDGKPVFGVGLMMKQEKGRWYVMVPTSVPGVGSILPKTADGWEILGDVVQVFDNTVTDLTDDVRKGRCKRLEDLAAKAGDKAFLPAVMVFFAYGKYMEAERPADQKNQPRRRNRGPQAPSGAPSAPGGTPAPAAATPPPGPK